MALTANTPFSQVLEDNHSYAVVKFGYHAEGAAEETDVLKVNTATLVGRTLVFNTSNTITHPLGFQPGERVTGATSNAHAWVKSWNAVSKKLEVVDSDAAFNGTEVVAGALFGTSITLTSITTPVYIVAIRSIWYDVHGGKIELEWGDGAGFKSIITLSGQGYFGENALGTLIKNNADNPNGNIYLSTHGVPAHTGGYSIVLELSKQAGFAQRPVY